MLSLDGEVAHTAKLVQIPQPVRQRLQRRGEVLDEQGQEGRARGARAAGVEEQCADAVRAIARRMPDHRQVNRRTARIRVIQGNPGGGALKALLLRAGALMPDQPRHRHRGPRSPRSPPRPMTSPAPLAQPPSRGSRCEVGSAATALSPPGFCAGAPAAVSLPRACRMSKPAVRHVRSSDAAAALRYGEAPRKYPF